MERRMQKDRPAVRMRHEEGDVTGCKRQKAGCPTLSLRGSPCDKQHVLIAPEDNMPKSWGYDDHNGPSTWLEKYPPARGESQSPIDLVTALVQSSSDLKDSPLVRSYEPQVCKRVINTGSGWRVDIDSGPGSSGLAGGPLEAKYELVQFHCHWGSSYENGSEHTVDGMPYVGELHFVHWNKDAFEKCSDAISESQGLAVLGVFLEIGEENPEIGRLCKAISQIPFQDQTSPLPDDFDIESLFPGDKSYWTYEGSLTTPPCYESVTWIVYKNPITVSKEQLECFRGMHCHGQEHDVPEGDSCCGQVRCNFRPPQDLHDRHIRECTFD